MALQARNALICRATCNNDLPVHNPLQTFRARATPRSQLNAHMERFIQTLQHECLDHFVCFGTRHPDRLLKEYLEHYHEERTHQSLGNVPLSAELPLRLGRSTECENQCRVSARWVAAAL